MSLEINGFEFDGFFLDVREKVLRRDGKPLSITPKAFRLLHILVENHGHLVEREQLINTVWEDSFVEEGNLTFTIRLLRKALGDSKHNPRFIETVPKRGYRFVAKVRPFAANEEKTEKLTLVENGIASRKNESLSAVSRPTGVVVALADWRQEKVEDKADETKITAFPPKLELVEPRPRGRAKYRWIFIGACAVLLALAIGIGGYWRFSRSSSPANFRIANLTRLTSNGQTKVAAVSRDGRFVAYVLNKEGSDGLWLKNVATGSDMQILPPVGAVELSNLTFSPDGNHIYYSTQGSLFQLPILGGLPKKVLPEFGISRFYNPVSFSPDGRQFAFVRQSAADEETASLVIVDADGRNERVLAASRRPDIFWGSAAWSPDGKVIAVAAFGKVFAVRVADGEVTTISHANWSNVSQVVWSPDGESLLTVAAAGRSSIANQIWSLSYPGGETQNISNDLNNYQSISLTADGRSMVAVRTEQTAYIWTIPDNDPARMRQLTNGIDRYDGLFGLSCLTDGSIIYETVPRNGDGEIWLIDEAGLNSRQLSDEAGSSVVSNDGKYLVFQSKDDTGTGLFRFNLKSGEKIRLTKGLDVWAAFSPDGRWVIFTHWGEQVALWKVSIDGGEPRKLTNVPGFALSPAVSPNGKLIAFYWQKFDRKEPPEIAILPSDGGEVIRTFELTFQNPPGSGKNALQWTTDSRAIHYIAAHDGVSNIWKQPVDGTAPVRVTDFTDQLRIFNFAYSPDGRRLALSRGTFNRDVILIKNQE